MAPLPETYYAAAPSIIVTLFETAMPKVPAIGPMQRMTWSSLTREFFAGRRIGAKDGPNIVLARFKPEPDGRARRLKDNVLARTAIGLDFETSKKTGEVPPSIAVVAERVRAQGWSACIYSSHNHTRAAPRFRIVIPLSDEIDPALPAPEVVAGMLDLDGVLDRSKLGAQSVFYLPSAEPGHLADHETLVIEGSPIPADWMRTKASALLAAKEADQARQRTEALREAEARRAARSAAGFKPSESLIEAIRDRLDLAGELVQHGYQRRGNRYLYPGSETGIPGVHILIGNDGVARVFSHHAADPLAAGNLPSWCTVKAIDVVDVVTILDFDGDQRKALRELGKRFDINARSTQADGEELNVKVREEGRPEPKAPILSRLSLISAAECADAEPRRYVMKGTIAAGDVAIVIGPPGTGKSALVPLIGYAVAQGRAVFGRRVRAGKVLYVPAEDQHGMRSRVTALRQRHGEAPGFYLVDGVTDLFGKGGQADDLRALVRHEKPAIVVLDTVAAAFPGLRENESDDMGKVIGLARDLARGVDGERGPVVILLHHTPKADDSTPRGHGNLNGDADVVLRLCKEAGTGVVTASFTKNRNGPSDGVQFSFTIEAEAVGTDEDGDEITAPVAVECTDARPRGIRLTPTERRGRAILAEVITQDGKLLPCGPGYPPLAHGAPEDAWRQACEDKRLSPAENLEDRKHTFRAVYRALLNKGSIGAGDGLVWIMGPVGGG